MSKQESFEDIVDGQFPDSKWASLGLAAEFPLIPEESSLAEYVTDLVIGCNATRENMTKYTDGIANGQPADTSLISAMVLANHRFNILGDIYGDLAFDLNESNTDSNITFEALVAKACYDRFHRTDALVSISESEKSKLQAINYILRGLLLEEPTAEHFREVLVS